MSTILKERVVKRARKARRCDWCDEMIAVGDSYHYSVAVTDGDFSPYGYHHECLRAIGKMDRYDLECMSCGEGKRGLPEAK